MTTATLAPLTTFTAPVCRWQERYLDARPPYKLANTFTHTQCDLLVMFWADVETVQAEMESAILGERALANMAGVNPKLWLPDTEDRIQDRGYPLLKHWTADAETYARLHARRAGSWKEYRKGMKGERK